MGTKHTPGEWTQSKFANGNIVSKETGRLVANCMGYSTNMDNGEHIKESLANAKLIAAAPELLEALKNCLFGVEKMIGWEEVSEQAKEAIKKATE